MITASRMPILGIGNDIIEIGRIRSALDKHGVKIRERLFTKNEIDYCLKHKDPAARFAGRFSAKEAIVKSLGTGFSKQIGWLDIEVLNDSSGKPYVQFSNQLKEKLENTQVILSISHCNSYATAIALWVSNA